MYFSRLIVTLPKITSMRMVDNDRWAVLYCPKNGFTNPKKRWEKVEKALNDNEISFDYIQSEASGSVERLVKMMINNGYKTIVIVGGDSALNDATNCLMQLSREERDTIALAVIPNGMMNDFAHFWNIDDDDIESTVKWIKERRIRKIDVGCVRYVNSDNERCRRYFLNCVNIGLVADIMDIRRRTRSFFGSRTLSFLFSFLLLTFRRLEYKMLLKVNDDEIDRNVMTVCIGNAPGYGMTPNAVPYNGLLDVSVVYNPVMTKLFEGIYLFVKGKFLNHRSVHPYRTREVTIYKAERAKVGIDGRLLNTPKGEFTVNVELEALNFIIP